MTVEIRRRRWLIGTIAVLAGGCSAGYLWRFAVAGGGVVLAIALLLCALAVVYSAAWFRAGTPLLVADSTGLRVRLGSSWTGLPWDDVDRVEVVAATGRLHDGHLRILPADEPAALSTASSRLRLEAGWNRRLYGAALAVPYGLATTVSVSDLPGQLRALADSRAEVVGPDDASTRLEPRAPAGLAAVPAAAGPVTAAPHHRFLPADGPPPQPARREEVTLAMRREQVDGTLALSAAPDELLTEELPEISQLRRDAVELDAATDSSASVDGNISLIIDATTDLSAQAMRKVRRPAPERVEPENTKPAAESGSEHLQPLHLGSELRRARENLGLTVEDLADRTRIRPFVIDRMEADDFSPCGGDFYARGHLRMLARVLGISSEPLVETYDERFATSPVSLRAVFDVEAVTGATRMMRGGGGASWGGLVAAVVILVLIWGVARFLAADPSPAPSTSTKNSITRIHLLSSIHLAGATPTGGHRRAVGS